MLSCVGQKGVPVRSFVQARVKVQSLSEVVRFFVVDVPAINLQEQEVGGDLVKAAPGGAFLCVAHYVMFWQGSRRCQL